MFYDPNRLRSFNQLTCLLTPEGQSISYAQLADKVSFFGTSLSTSRTLIAVEAAADLDSIVAYLGALAAGHAVMLLPYDAPHISNRLEETFCPAMSFRQTKGEWHLKHLDHPPAKVHPDLALLLQTSGSTGHGRGVRLTVNAINTNAVSIVEYLEIGTDDRAALILPLHYSYGLSILNSHLAAGASVWLGPGSVLEAGFADALAASGATSLGGVPHHFQLIENAGLADTLPESLELLTVAGGRMPWEKVREWVDKMEARNGRFCVMYGQTEAAPRIAWLPPRLAKANPDAIGFAIPGGALSVRGIDGTEIQSADCEGELIYCGPNVMMGYAENHEDLSRGHEIEALATGDLAQRSAEGIYRITGRLSRMSKVAGLRIGHDALERALAARGREVAVWGDDGTISIAVVGRAAGLEKEAARLTEIGAQHFRVLSLKELPRHPNGKVDYPALKKFLSPPSSNSCILCAYRAAFAPTPVKRRDSFTSLGGDSLKHVELTLALEERLGGVPDGWEEMAVADLEKATPPKVHSLPTDIVVRVFAILAVVVGHQTQWPIYGGAAAMIILMGMSVSAFRWNRLAKGEIRAFLEPMISVLIPYYAVLAGYALAWGEVPWISVLLIGNFALTIPETHQMLPYLYWFIEAYAQMTLLIAVIFLLPPVRHWFAELGQFRVGLLLLAIAVAARLTIPEIWPMGGRALFTLPWVFYLFAFGWCIAAARGVPEKLIVLAAACTILPVAAYLGGNWHGSWIKYSSLMAIAVLLLFVTQISMPRVMLKPLMRVAQAAFPIYLLHRIMPEVLLPMAGFEGRGIMIDSLAIGGGIALGLVAASVQRKAGSIWIWLQEQGLRKFART